MMVSHGGSNAGGWLEESLREQLYMIDKLGHEQCLFDSDVSAIPRSSGPYVGDEGLEYQQQLRSGAMAPLVLRRERNLGQVAAGLK
jgi:hypothetical protein